MSLATVDRSRGDVIESVLIRGDLSKLGPDERNEYYLRVCDSAGLNPLTQPFDYLTLNGKLVLYAKKACTDQLRTIHDISVVEMSETERDGVFIVTCKVRNAAGRTDIAKGAVTIGALKGDALCNAIMKAETKAKRRATLSICGLGLLDEAEIETIPGAPPIPSPAPEAGETFPQPPASRPQNSSQAKKAGAWERFTQRLESFANLSALEEWWENPDTKSSLRLMPAAWQEQATEAYEKRQEFLAEKLQRELDEERRG